MVHENQNTHQPKGAMACGRFGRKRRGELTLNIQQPEGFFVNCLSRSYRHNVNDTGFYGTVDNSQPADPIASKPQQFIP
jgi:hypothetical protein